MKSKHDEGFQVLNKVPILSCDVGESLARVDISHELAELGDVQPCNEEVLV